MRVCRLAGFSLSCDLSPTSLDSTPASSPLTNNHWMGYYGLAAYVFLL